MPSSAASESARERMIATAAALLAERGLRSLTARSLAEMTGQSASAVNYHFAGREGLLAATFEVSARGVADWRETWLATLAAAPPPAAFPNWFLAHILASLARAEDLLVLRELRHHAARASVHRSLAGEVQAASDAFWERVADEFALRPGAAGVCADFSEAILGIHGGAPDHPDQMAWLMETTQRLCARLAGDRGGAPGWDGWRQQARVRARRPARPEPVGSNSAPRIAAAAAEVLGRAGMEALTHRAVAAEAGFSLAAVSGYFPSRASLVQAAFDHLIGAIQSVRGGAVPDLAEKRPVAEVAREMAETLFDAEGAALPGLLALDELLTAAIRDGELRREAEDLRASRGENSAELLDRLDHATQAADGLDAHLLSIITTGAMRSAYVMEPQTRRGWLTRRLEASLSALLG